MVTDAQVQAAEVRFEEKRKTVPFAKEAYFVPKSHFIFVELSSGYSISFAPERAQGLPGASDEALSEIEISSGGYGVHFPKLDADFSVEGLLAGRFGSAKWEQEWAEKHKEMQAA
jgi:hypothetical protein